MSDELRQNRGAGGDGPKHECGGHQAGRACLACGASGLDARADRGGPRDRAERCVAALNAAGYRGLRWERGDVGVVGRGDPTSAVFAALSLDEAEQEVEKLAASKPSADAPTPIERGSRWASKGSGTPVVVREVSAGIVAYEWADGREVMTPVKEFPKHFAPAPDDDAPVATPGHYAWSGVPPIDVIEAWGMGPPFCLGNAIKYIGRWKHKDGLADLRKAQDYIGRAIAMLEKEAGR